MNPLFFHGTSFVPTSRYKMSILALASVMLCTIAQDSRAILIQESPVVTSRWEIWSSGDGSTASPTPEAAFLKNNVYTSDPYTHRFAYYLPVPIDSTDYGHCYFYSNYNQDDPNSKWYLALRDGVTKRSTLSCRKPFTLQDRMCVLDTADYKEAGDDSCEQSAGSPSANPTAGNPIMVGSGNKMHREVLYSGQGDFPLQVVLTYNSRGQSPAISEPGRKASLPQGWSFNFDRRLADFHTLDERQNHFYTLTRGNGNVFIFDHNLRVEGNAAALGDWLEEPGGHVLFLVNGEREFYDAQGRLLRLRDAKGQEQILSYNAFDRLENVTDQFGRSLHFSYVGDMLESITTPSGQVFRLAFEGGNLSGIIYPGEDAPQKSFVYGEGSNLLTGIIDELGKRYATWEYDAQGRGILSEHAGGVERVSINRDPFGTVVTDSLGNQQRYQFSKVVDQPKLVRQDKPAGSGCYASVAKLEYDASGNVNKRIEFDGSVTEFTYDQARKLLISKREASNDSAFTRVSQTIWHDVLPLPLKRATAKMLTTYEYDAHGNLLKLSEQATLDNFGTQGFAALTTGEARTWTYTYNSQNQVLTATGPTQRQA